MLWVGDLEDVEFSEFPALGENKPAGTVKFNCHSVLCRVICNCIIPINIGIIVEVFSFPSSQILLELLLMSAIRNVCLQTQLMAV